MTTPILNARMVEMHVAGNPAFTSKYGAKVRSVGGQYSDVRGKVDVRRVTLPGDETELLDAIFKDFPSGQNVTMIVRGYAGDGVDDRINREFAQASQRVFDWRPASGLKPSEALREFLDSTSRTLDWTAFDAKCKAEDDLRAAQALRERLLDEKEGLLEAIVTEALRILDGANDIDPLKDAASRYREVLASLGEEEPTTVEPDAGFAP